MKTQFLIAAPMSGCGKTTIARGLMALLVRRGLKVQPFKCGPDYIDTKFHEAVCGRPSINLDTFMAPLDHVRRLYHRYAEGADVCIVEGMMGMFDGYDRDRGSCAEIARLLQLPVILVVNARSAAYSIAPLLQGFIQFRNDVHVAGVIFNQVGSERHVQMLRQVCKDVGIRWLGHVPRNSSLEVGSRYLGLDFSQQPESQELIKLLEANIDWPALLELGNNNPDCPEPLETSQKTIHDCTLVARNAESFSFLYQETIDALPHPSYFNPETEVPNLEGINLLYLPGGYPEKHLEALVEAEQTRKAIHDYAERGGRIIAECGGMMYLCQKIITDEGEYPMCGVLPYNISARKADRHLSLGYRHFTFDGHSYRGHEFHYTQFVPPLPPSATQVYNAQGEPVDTPVIRYKNVLASYTHLYLNETNLY